MKPTLFQAPLLFYLALSLIMLGCDTHAKNKSKEPIILVQQQIIAAPQIFLGAIKPLKMINMSAPTDGTITAVNVHLGQTVKKQDLIMVLNSAKFAKDYQQALLTYLKTKSDYSAQVKKFQGTQELWTNGLIARNDYDSQQAELANSYAMLMQQQSDLKKFLSPEALTKKQFDLQDKAEINALFTQQNATVNIYAATDGVVLAPLKSASNNNQDSMNLPVIGTLVKEGDSLLNLGNMTGYIVTVNISQMDIGSVKMGQKAIVTGDAFSANLSGYVSQVSIQAKTDGSSGFSGMPTFPVDITIPHLPTLVDNPIRLGMSAKVSLIAPINSTLSIPISAVLIKNGQSFVMRQVHNKRQRTPITTGLTSLDQVQVLSGLNSGDAILATYPTWQNH